MAQQRSPDVQPTATGNQNLQLVAIALLAVAWLTLMTWRLGARSLHVDEVLTAYRAEQPGRYLDPMHPRTYYDYVALWTRVVGSNDAGLRSSNLIPAAVAVLCLGTVACWLLPWPAWFIALVLACFSSELLLYWRMARYFAPAAAGFGMLMVGAVGRYRYRTADWLALAAAGTAVLMYTDYLAAAGSIVPWAWLLAVEWRRGRRQAAGVLIAGAAAAVVCLPAVAWGLHGASKVVRPGVLGYPAKAYLFGLAVAGWGLTAGECLPPWQPLPAAAAIIGMVTAGAVGLREGWRRGGPWRLVIAVWPWAVALAFFATAMTPGEPPVRLSSLALYAMPYALLVVALGLWILWPRPVGKAVAMLVAAGYFAGLSNYFAMRNHLNPQYAMNWNVVARYIAQRASPGDLIVTIFDGGFHRYYDGPGDGVEVHTVKIKPYVRQAKEVLRRGKRVWLISRDRGSIKARELINEFLNELRASGASVEEHSLLRYNRRELPWRRLVHHSDATAYVTVYELWLPQHCAQPE